MQLVFCILVLIREEPRRERCVNVSEVVIYDGSSKFFFVWMKKRKYKKNEGENDSTKNNVVEGRKRKTNKRKRVDSLM